MSDLRSGGAPEGEEIHASSQVVPDGDLSKERLLSLIRLGREEEALDYKRSYDLSGKVTKDRVEMVADVVAMANTSGGYVVLGVDERRSGTTIIYEPVGIAEDHLKSLDMSRLKPQIERYVNVSIPIKLQLHRLDEHEGRCFALVYVEESPESPIIMEKDGQYQDESGRSQEVFRAGDVLVRNGASSQRANQSAVRDQVSKIRHRERERWTEEILGVRELVERLDRLVGVLDGGAATPNVTEAPRGTKPLPRFEDADYLLGATAFERMVLEALRADQDIDLLWYLNNAAPTFYRALEEAAEIDDPAEVNRIRDNRLEPLLDNLAVLAITCAKYWRPQYLAGVRDALYDIYERAHITGFDKPSLWAEIRQSWVWEAVIKRVYTIGAALLWLNLYDEVPLFIRQRILWDDYWRDRFWARHALTMRARDGLLARQGLCALTKDFIRGREWFYRVFRENEGTVIDALCQFDFLQCIHAINESDDAGAGYPSFGVYNNSRTEPILSNVIGDNQVREALLPQMPDDRFANIVKVLDQKTGREFVTFNGWDSNYWQDPEVQTFLGQFPDPAPSDRGR